MLLTVLIAAILVTTYGQIILNQWNQPFYDAITRRDLNDFLYQLGVYFVIVASLARSRRRAALAQRDDPSFDCAKA